MTLLSFYGRITEKRKQLNTTMFLHPVRSARRNCGTYEIEVENLRSRSHKLGETESIPVTLNDIFKPGNAKVFIYGMGRNGVCSS